MHDHRSDDPQKARNALQHPEGRPLEKRVEQNTSDRSGNLEDQNLDIDARTLALLGKRQRLNRNFGLVSMIAFATTLQASWVSVAVTFQYGMIQGGPVNLFYGLIFGWLGSMAIAGSMAEMSSMMPTAGAQYHWTAGLAPVRFAVAFSWASGWVTVFARISLFASTSFVASQVIQGMIVLNVDGFSPAQWQGTLIYWAVILLLTVVNILGIRKFPHIETVAFIFFVCLFFVFLVPLVYLTPQSKASFVFTDYENSSGWSSDGLVWFLGLLNAAYTFVGIDGTSHMSEEVRKSNVAVPKSMVLSQLINGVFAIAMTIILLFGIGDIKTMLSTKTKYPIIQILYGATGSKGATTALIALMTLVILFTALGILASASRLTWAFARDNGLPFPKTFAHVSWFFLYLHVVLIEQQVNRSYMIPVRAILFVAVVAGILGVVNIGSKTAFHAIISLALIGHYTSYLLPTLLLAIRRFNKKEIPFGPWSMGKLGLWVNLAAIAYLIIVIVFMVFPPYQPVTASNLNYAGPIFGLTLILSIVFWITYGRRVYHGPVQEVIEQKNIKP